MTYRIAEAPAVSILIDGTVYWWFVVGVAPFDEAYTMEPKLI